MLRAVLFPLVPAWVALFSRGHGKEPAVSTYYERAKWLASVIQAQTRPDEACWLQPDEATRPLPERHEVSRLSYPALRCVAERFLKRVSAPQGLSHGDYVRFCMQLFWADPVAGFDVKELSTRFAFFLNVAGSLQERWGQFAFDLQGLAAASHARGGDASVMEFVDRGFFGWPKTTPAQLETSLVLSKVRRLRMCPAAHHKLFRLERFVNATCLDVQHVLGLAKSNLERHFNALSLALQLCNQVPGHLGLGACRYPEPVDRDLSRREIAKQDQELTHSQTMEAEVFRVLLNLMRMRSAFVDKDGSVHQKLWKTRRVDGWRCDSTESVIEQQQIATRTWLHALQQTYDSVEQLFMTLSGSDMLSLSVVLLSGKSNNMREILGLWPALRCPRRNEHVATWPNGLFNATTAQFIALNHPQRLVPCTLVASKHFRKQNFPQAALNVMLWATSRHGHGHTLPELPTRHARMVLETQGFSRKERGNIMALMGRTKHELRARDNWDVMLMFMGTAGVGKSTFMDILTSLFDDKDVARMQNRLEREFGLEGVYEKQLVVASDIDENFTLDQAVLHSIIVGEGVTVCRKGKTTLSIRWKGHLVASSNGVPGRYQDSDDSLTRRLWVVLCKKVIGGRRNPNIVLHFESKEVPFFLFMMMWHYEELLLRKPGASLWDICEPKFKETRQSLRGQLSVVEGFLRSAKITASALVKIKLELAGMSLSDTGAYKAEHVLLLDARYQVVDDCEVQVRFPDGSLLVADGEPVIAEDELTKEFASYAKNQHMKVSFNKDLYEGVFQRYGILHVRQLPGFPQGAFVGIKRT